MTPPPDAAQDPNPLSRFLALFDEARRAYPVDFNAVTLATVSPQGRPAARVVLLKGADERGFVFYTNLESRKGKELRQHPWAALCFFWPALEQQVRVEGKTEQVSDAEADAYFATRPRGSQLGAWASLQSQPLDSRATLDERAAQLERTYAGAPIPRPPHWSGFLLVPDRMEFWKAGPNRLHDRWVYEGSPRDGWRVTRLYP